MERRVAKETYTDEQVTAACDIHVDNLRRLITWRAVKPAQSGGGRGRVRKWTIDQVMRIAATAEITRAGFSLQMAHTLVCGLPTADILDWHDPEFIRAHVDLSQPVESYMRALIMPEVVDYWPPDDVIGTQLYVLDGTLVYGDLTGDAPLLSGIIDPERNEFHPLWSQFRHGWARADGTKRKPYLTKRERRNVLIPDFYFTASDDRISRRTERLMRALEAQTAHEPDELQAISSLRINLAAGLRLAFRKLLGLPVEEPSLRSLLDEFIPKEPKNVGRA